MIERQKKSNPPWRADPTGCVEGVVGFNIIKKIAQSQIMVTPANIMQGTSAGVQNILQ